MSTEPPPESASRRLTAGQLQRRALDGALWTVFHTVLSLPLAFFVNIVLARVLGVVNYGRLAFLTTVIELISLIAGAGISAALVQFGSKAHAAGRASDVEDLLMRTQGFRLLVLAPVITGFVIALADVPRALLLSAVIFGVWLPAFTGGAAVCMSIENRTATGAKLAMLLNFLLQAAVLSTVLITEDPDSVWNARMIVGGLAPLMSLAVISPLYRSAVLKPKLPRRFPAGFWRYSVPIGLSGVVATLAVSRSEVLVLERMADPAQVGIYAMAFGLATHLMAPAQAFINPLTPAVSGLRETAPQKVAAAFGRTVRLTATAAGTINACAAPLLALLVPLIYGQEFQAAAPMVLVMTFAASLLFVTAPMVPFVTARLRGASMLKVNLIALFAGVVVLIPLVNLYGAWGAVWGKIVITLARYVCLLIFERDSFEVTRVACLKASSPVLLGGLVGAVAYFPSSGLEWRSQLRGRLWFCLGELATWHFLP